MSAEVIRLGPRNGRGEEKEEGGIRREGNILWAAFAYEFKKRSPLEVRFAAVGVRTSSRCPFSGFLGLT